MHDRLSILVFAYVFPPDAGSGTFRTLHFTNRWAGLGDNVTVVTVAGECILPDALMDHGLLAQVHPEVQVVRAKASRPLQVLLRLQRMLRRKPKASTKGASVATAITTAGRPGHARNIVQCVKDTITDLFSCPDEHVGWVPDAVRQANRIARKRHFDCMYATGGPWSAMLAGTIVSRMRRIPLVLDFRDPWISNPNMRARSPLSRWIQKRLESMCIRASSLVVANTEELRADFIRRYPHMRQDRFITVTNGFEVLPRCESAPGDRFAIVHAGALYQSRNPSNFIQALIQLLEVGALPATAVRVQLIGGISITDPAIEHLLRTEVLSGVLEIMPRVPHVDAVRLQQRASVLMLIQTGFPLQVPRKLYEYLSLGRPVLAIAEPEGATARMIRELNAGYVAADEIEAIKRAVLSLYAGWKRGVPCTVNAERVHSYRNDHLAMQLRDSMRAVLQTRLG
jgi:hypothetical protein